MPDITMCLNKYCPKAKECQRNLLSGTQSSEHQSVSAFEHNKNGCEYFKNRS